MRSNVASFLVAAVAAGGLCLPAAARAKRAAPAPVVALRPVRRLLAASAAFDFFIAAVTPVEAAFVIHTLGGTEGDLGVVLAAWGAGMVLSGMLGGRAMKAGLLPALAVTAALQATAMLGMGLSGSVATVVAFSLVGGLGNGIYCLAVITALQERTPASLQSRLNAAWEATMAVAPGLGFALGAIVAATGSVRAVYLIAGAGGLAVVALAAAAERYPGARPSSSPASALSPA